MTVLTPTMVLPVREPAPEAMGKSIRSEGPSCADTDARRIAAAVAEGSETAFRELYDRYHDRVFRLALVIGRGDESLAHETAQSVFLAAASKLRRIECEEHLWNWLARVARQQIGKSWRRNKSESRTVALEELPEQPGAEAAENEMEEKLDTALLAMESDERKLLEWFYFDRLSHKDIGERLNLTAKAVSSRLERARAKLRLLLKPEG
jgi:RNA polymerase sigma factor (sigma-70 family)